MIADLEKKSDLNIKYKPYGADDARQLVQNRIGSTEKAEKKLKKRKKKLEKRKQLPEKKTLLRSPPSGCRVVVNSG